MSGTKTSPLNAGKAFSVRAVNFLVNFAGIRSAGSIAGTLGRTPKSIRRKAEKLGVSLAVNG
jgi:hypothetical protein